MGYRISNNFTLRAKKFLDERQSFNTIEELMKFSAVPEGFIAYCKEDGNYYRCVSEKPVEWEILEFGGQGLTEEQLEKLEAAYEHSQKDHATIEGLATEEFVKEQIEAIDHPTYDDSELREMIEAIKVPSIEGLATEEFVRNAIAEAELNGGEQEVDLSGFATKEELARVEGQIPSTKGLASEDFVREQIEAIEHPQYDDSELRGMIEAIEVPSIEGLASEQYVQDEIAKIEHPQFDDSHLATKERVEELQKALEEEIARAKAREDEIAAEIDDEEPYMAALAAYPTSKFLFACGHPVYVEGQEDGSVVVSYKWSGEMVGITLSAEDAAKTYIVGGYGHDNHNSKRSLPMTKIVAKDAKIKGIVGGHYFEGIVGHAHIEAENCQMVSVMAGGWCGANVDGRTTRLNIVHEAECKLTNCTISSTFFGGSQGNGTVDKSHVVLDGVKAGWVTVGGSNGLTNGGHLEVKGDSDIKVLQTVNRGLVRKAVVDVHEGHIEQLFVGGETEDSSVDGIVKEVEMNLMGGVVDKLRLGTSEGQPFAGQLVGSMRQPEVKESEVDLDQFRIIEDEVEPEIPSLDGYATEQYVQEAIEAIEHPQYDDSELRGMIEAIEVPSIEGLASEEFVIEKIAEAQLEQGEVDLSQYATKDDLESVQKEIPSIKGLATEDFVKREILKAEMEREEIDLTPYATKEFVQEQINGVEIPSVEGLATKNEVDTKVSELRDMLLGNSSRIDTVESNITELRNSLLAQSNRIDTIEKTFVKTMTFKEEDIVFKSGDDTELFVLDVMDDADVAEILNFSK